MHTHTHVDERFSSFFTEIIYGSGNSGSNLATVFEAKCSECDSERPQRDARARAENSMFPGGFNAVLTDWQIPRLNSAKSFHQDAHMHDTFL